MFHFRLISDYSTRHITCRRTRVLHVCVSVTCKMLSEAKNVCNKCCNKKLYVSLSNNSHSVLTVLNVHFYTSTSRSVIMPELSRVLTVPNLFYFFWLSLIMCNSFSVKFSRFPDTVWNTDFSTEMSYRIRLWLNISTGLFMKSIQRSTQYTVVEEERSIFWEVILPVIVRNKKSVWTNVWQRTVTELEL